MPSRSDEPGSLPSPLPWTAHPSSPPPRAVRAWELGGLLDPPLVSPVAPSAPLQPVHSSLSLPASLLGKQSLPPLIPRLPVPVSLSPSPPLPPLALLSSHLSVSVRAGGGSIEGIPTFAAAVPPSPPPPPPPCSSMAGHEWDWFQREELIGQISDIRVQNLQGKKTNIMHFRPLLLCACVCVHVCVRRARPPSGFGFQMDSIWGLKTPSPSLPPPCLSVWSAVSFFT